MATAARRDSTGCKFHVGEYFKTKEFLDVVPVRFNISDARRPLPRAAAVLAVELYNLPRELR